MAPRSRTRSLEKYLRSLGATPKEIEMASEGGWLAYLAIDRTLIPGSARYTIEEAALRSETDPETLARLWRAMGFQEPESDRKVFADLDIEAAHLYREQVDNGADSEVLLKQLRVVAQSMTTIAEIVAETVLAQLGRDSQTMGTTELARQIIMDFNFDEVSQIVDFVLRRELQAAIRRQLSWAQHDSASELCVGFVDLVGFTTLSRNLEHVELAELVDRFEALASDVIAQMGGRQVKKIGDEVMFVAKDTSNAVNIALRLTRGLDWLGDALPEQDVEIRARAGLAQGNVLAQGGDYFGAPVNLASRLVSVAGPGMVVVEANVHDDLLEDEDFSFRPLWPRILRSYGPTRLWEVRHSLA
ncbi:MAG: hypothetical protein KA110_02785 [Acidimicrobiia bacterium]|nr:hypothetical protein [Acidimicrobiia bacterium]